MFGSTIGPGEIALVLLIALVIFGPKRLPELGQGLSELLPDLVAFQCFRRNLAPIGEVARRVIAVLIRPLGDGLHNVGVRLSSSHTRLVDGDLDKPGAEPRFGSKLSNVFERL